MLQAELKMGGVGNVGIHNLSPGMVTTELLLSGALPSGAQQSSSAHAITSTMCAMSAQKPSVSAMLKVLAPGNAVHSHPLPHARLHKGMPGTLAASPRTELLTALRSSTAGSDTPTARFFINCLAETPETVAEHLVPRIRAVPRDSRTLGGGISQACCNTGSVQAVLLAEEPWVVSAAFVRACSCCLRFVAPCSFRMSATSLLIKAHCVRLSLFQGS